MPWERQPSDETCGSQSSAPIFCKKQFALLLFSDILISLWNVINRAFHGYCRTKHSDTRRNGKQAPDGRSGPANRTITIASCPEVRGEPHHRFTLASGVKRKRRGVAPETARARSSQPPFGGP